MNKGKFYIFLISWFFLFFCFAGNHNDEEERDQQLALILDLLLEKAANYCDRLKKEVLHYICKEEIIENFYPFQANPYRVYKRKIKKFTYDYQIIKTGSRIKERRILVEEDGKKTYVENAPLKTTYFYSYRSFYGPIGLLGREWQQYYNYKIEKRFTEKGDNIFVLNAAPIKKKKNKPNHGKLWVRESDGAVLRIEISQESLPGLESLLRNARRMMAKLQITVNHEYKESFNGLFYPAKTEFIESYTGGAIIHKSYNNGRYICTRTLFLFKDYQFFSVATKTIEEK